MLLNFCYNGIFWYIKTHLFLKMGLDVIRTGGGAREFEKSGLQNDSKMLKKIK